MADLKGRVVAFLESRRSAELADLLRRHNAVPLAAPCFREVHEPDAPELAEAVDVLCRDDVPFAVFLTRVGFAAIMDAARHRGQDEQLRAALARKKVAARGPKTRAGLYGESIPVTLTTEAPHTSEQLVEGLSGWDLRDRNIAVQVYGKENPELRGALERQGAHVRELSPYAWALPLDRAPVLELVSQIEQGGVDVLLITSQGQLENLLALAKESKRLDGLLAGLHRVAVGAQGPVVEAALTHAGIRTAFRPESPHMGALVLAAARYFDQLENPPALEPLHQSPEPASRLPGAATPHIERNSVS